MTEMKVVSLKSLTCKGGFPFVSRRQSNIRVWHTEGYLLENSPSRTDGVSQLDEYRWLRTSIRMIQVACQRLHLDHAVSHTASVLCHRFFAIRSMKEPTHRYYITTACVFLAAKMEDITSVTAEEVCKTCHNVRVGRKGQAQLTDKTFLRTEIEYMLRCEAVILQVLNFPDSPVHPFAVVIKVLKGLNLVELTPQLKESNLERYTIISMLMNLTLSSINDSRFTSLCLQYSHETLGMAALWLTLKKVATKFPHFSLLPAGVEFHDHYSLELSVLQDVETQMLAKSADSFTYETEAGFLPLPAPRSLPQPTTTQPLHAEQPIANPLPADAKVLDESHAAAVQQLLPVTVHQLQLLHAQQLQSETMHQPQPAAVAAWKPSMTPQQPQELKPVSPPSSADTVMKDSAGEPMSAKIAFKTIKALQRSPQRGTCSQPPTLARRLHAAVDASPLPARASSADTSQASAVSRALRARATSADPSSAGSESSASRKHRKHKHRRAASTSPEPAVIDPNTIIWACEYRCPASMENWLVRVHTARTWKHIKAVSGRWKTVGKTAVAVENFAAETKAAAMEQRFTAALMSRSRTTASKPPCKQSSNAPLSPVAPSFEPPSDAEVAVLARKPYSEFVRSPFAKVLLPAVQPPPDEADLRAFLAQIPADPQELKHFQRENSPVSAITVEVFPKRVLPEKPNLSHLWFPNKKKAEPSAAAAAATTAAVAVAPVEAGTAAVAVAVPAAAVIAAAAAVAVPAAAVIAAAAAVAVPAAEAATVHVAVAAPVSGQAEDTAGPASAKPKSIRLHMKPASKPLTTSPVSTEHVALPAPVTSLAESPRISPPSAAPSIRHHTKSAVSSGDSQDKAAGGSHGSHHHHRHKTSSSSGKKSKQVSDCSSPPEPDSPVHLPDLSPASPQAASNFDGCGSVAPGNADDGAPESPQSTPAAQSKAATLDNKRKRFWGETRILLPGGEVKRVCNGSSRAETQAEEARLMPPPPCRVRQPVAATTDTTPSSTSPVVLAGDSSQKSSDKRTFCSMMSDALETLETAGSPLAARPCIRVEDPSTVYASASEENADLQCSSEQQPAAAPSSSSPLKRRRDEDDFDDDEAEYVAARCSGSAPGADRRLS